MTYDPVDANDDGVVESDVDNAVVKTEQAHTESRGPSVAVHIKDGGTIVADGPDGELASGDSTTTADVTSVLQAALDNGGHVKVKPGTYTMGVGGQDGEGEDYCLNASDHTKFEIEAGATLEYPADDSQTPPDVASPILVHDTANFEVCGNGTIDAGYHAEPAQDVSVNTMGIKVGVRDQPETSTDIVVRDITASGAFRHFVETIGAPDNGPERVLVEGVTFDDASGDDDISYSIGTRHATARDCWSINKKRGENQFWTAACFEAEDGARHVVFDSLYCIAPDTNGITIGKSHATDPPSKNHTAVNCTVIDSGNNAFSITPSGDGQTTESIHFRNCTAINAASQGVTIGGSGDHLITDVTLDLTIRGVGDNGVNVIHSGGTLEDLTIPSTTKMYDVETYCVRFSDPPDGRTHRDFDINGATLNSTRTPIQMAGPATSYEGLSKIRNCNFESGSDDWPDHRAGSDPDLYKNVLAINNNSEDDAVSVPPENAETSMWYIDDGTNTGTGTMGKRVYDGSVWFDAWTA